MSSKFDELVPIPRPDGCTSIVSMRTGRLYAVVPSDEMRSNPDTADRRGADACRTFIALQPKRRRMARSELFWLGFLVGFWVLAAIAGVAFVCMRS